MTAIRSSTGLASGLDIQSLASALVARQQAVITRVQQQGARFEAEQTALSVIEASVLTLQSSATALEDIGTFREFSTSGGSETAYRVSPGDGATPGDYTVRPVRLASAQTTISRGFASPTASVGTGTVTVRTGGEVARAVSLGTLNGGAGVTGGTVRVTDRSGDSADVDLSTATNVQEVLDAINAADVAVTARAVGDRFVLTDTSGGAGNLTVADIEGGAAEDLGIAGSVAAETLTGSDVYDVTGAFALDLLNDGLGPKIFAGAADIRVTARDGSTHEVTLDDAGTLGDVADAIAAATGGAVTAAVTGGRLVLTDTTAGGGTLSVEDINGSYVTSELGLDGASAGGVLNGRRLGSGLNSTLLRNVRGGRGITAGTVSLTSRAGLTATVDVSAAETLDDVVSAINAASDAGTPLGLTAAIDETGTGIVVRDTSGGPGNLIVADVTGSTAADLGIAVNGAVDSVAGGPLDRRFVGNDFSLARYAADGQAFDPGQIQITDSAGNTAAVSVSAAVKTVGDLVARINAASGINVRAELNETGDGFAIVDEAGGGGVLEVLDLDGTTAADLRLNAVSLNSAGETQISSRYAAVVQLSAGDSLEDLSTQLAEQADFLRAGLIDDGSSVSPTRLSLSSRDPGRAGRLFIETDGIDLGLTTTSEAADAVAVVGPGRGFVVTSSSNRFENVPGGFDLDVYEESASAQTISIDRDFTSARDAVESFVSGFNAVIDAIREQTRFDPETLQRGTLQGNTFVQRVESRLQRLVSGAAGASATLPNLTAIGVRANELGELEFDADRFDTLAETDPDELSAFFSGDAGFGGKLDTLVESLTDTIDGDFTVRKDSLGDRVADVTRRVDNLTELMAARRERLFAEFVRMEQILSDLQGQQQQITALGGFV